MRRNRIGGMGWALAWALVLAAGGWAGPDDGSGVAADKERITRQIQEHHYRWDSGDLESWAQLFTEDAVCHAYVTGTAEPVWTSGDRDSLVKASRDYLGKQAGIQSRHHPSAIQFLELTGTAAVTRHTVLVTQQEAGKAQPGLAASGIYIMRWIKVGGEWRIRQRDFYKD